MRRMDPVVRKAVVGKTPDVALQRMHDLLQSSDDITSATVGAVLHLCETGNLSRDADTFVAKLLEKNFSWDESSSSKAMKVLCAGGNYNTAMELLRRSGDKIKRRDLEPIFAYCRNWATVCEARDLAKSTSVELLDVDYACIVRTAQYLNPPNLPELVHRVLEDMRDDIPIPSSVFADALKGLPGQCTRTAVMTDGTCQCGTALKHFPFPDEYRTRLMADVCGLPKNLSPELKQKFEDFKHRVHQQRIDVVIDGANVGYAGLSAWGALESQQATREAEEEEQAKRLKCDDLEWRRKPPTKVAARLEQVEAVLKELSATRSDLRAVVVMHERHFDPDTAPPRYHELVERWKANGTLVVSPSGVNDDVCWMYAAVYHSTASRPAFIVSNDKMRDHHYQMLSQRSFTRWRDTSRVTYNILAPGMKAVLHFPSHFSTCIQHDSVTRKWHVPVQTPSEGPIEWLCVDS